MHFVLKKRGYFLNIVIIIFSRVAWLIGWALILEYTIGGSAVARGISPNVVRVICTLGLYFANLFSFVAYIFSVCEGYYTPVRVYKVCDQ